MKTLLTFLLLVATIMAQAQTKDTIIDMSPYDTTGLVIDTTPQIIPNYELLRDMGENKNCELNIRGNKEDLPYLQNLLKAWQQHRIIVNDTNKSIKSWGSDTIVKIIHDTIPRRKRSIIAALEIH